MISSFSDIDYDYDYDYDYEIDLLCSFYLTLLAVMIPSLQISIQVGLQWTTNGCWRDTNKYIY